jgi:SAM-dependent methyltransferase
MQVSDFDIAALSLLRENVNTFISRSSELYGGPNTLLLDIAPQDHCGAAPFFTNSEIHTLDIDPGSNATYIADLCADSETVPANYFDYVVCTEVLEHTLQPFRAVANIYKFLKPGGMVFVSTPFNFRIHGPLPDCWRFTEHGLRALFEDFDIVDLSALETADRFLMPIQYTLVARKVAPKDSGGT